MSRPAKIPTITFDDAMTVHVLRAEGFTYGELCRLFCDHTSRITQILDGTLHSGSWEAAVDRLSRGHYWHPRIVAVIFAEGGVGPLLSATRAADPARRRFRQAVKRANRFSIPFCRRPPRLGTAA